MSGSFFSKKKKLTFASYEYKFVMALGMASIDSVRMQSRVGDKGGIDCIIGTSQHLSSCALSFFLYFSGKCSREVSTLFKITPLTLSRHCYLQIVLKATPRTVGLLSGAAGRSWCVSYFVVWTVFSFFYHSALLSSPLVPVHQPPPQQEGSGAARWHPDGVARTLSFPRGPST